MHSVGCWGKGHKHRHFGKQESHMLVRKEGGGGDTTLGSAEGQEARPGLLLLQLLCDAFLCQPCLCLLASGQVAMAGLAHHRSLPNQEHGWRCG